MSDKTSFAVVGKSDLGGQGRFKLLAGFLWPVILAIVLVSIYSYVAFLVSGSNEWWYIDFVADGNVFWGDDAYRYFLARSAWSNTDVYWFNFVLPIATVLDGVITTISGDSLFYARAIKSLSLTASLFFTYHAALRLGANKLWAAIGVALLALMPLYVFIGLSFYGEAWFSFLVAISLYTLAHKYWRLSALVIGLMPLVRLEGLYFVIGFSLCALMRRDWRNALIVFLPGLTYGLMVMFVGPGVGVYTAWRLEMTQFYEAVGHWYGGELSQFWQVFFWPWLLCSLIALFQKGSRAILPCVIGMAVICLWQLISSIFLGISRFEPRFLVPLLPVLAVGFAIFMTGQWELWGKEKFRRVFVVVAPCFIFIILVWQVCTMHVFNELRAYVLSNLELPESVRENPFRMATYFKKVDSEELKGYREYADVATRMMVLNPSIKTLVVSSPYAVYFLDPLRISADVKVVFALFGMRTLGPALGGGETVGYFAHPPFLGRFPLSYAEKNTDLLLYMDKVAIPDYPFHWVVRGNDIFLFSSGPMLSANQKE